MTRRGFSLVEMCVVVMIGLVLLFALLPVALELWKHRRQVDDVIEDVVEDLEDIVRERRADD